MSDAPHDQPPAAGPSSSSVRCFGKLVRLYRTQRGWTQLELATAAGVSERVIRKLEHGEPVRRSTVEHIAQTLATPDQPLNAGDLTTDPMAVAQAFVRGYLQYKRDAARVCAHLFSSDVVLVIHTDAPNLAFGGEFHGLEGIDQMLQQAFSQFEPVESDFGRWFHSGPRVAAMRREVLRPAGVETDQVLETWIMHEYTVSQGRLTRIDNYLDSLAWSRYLDQHGPDDALARETADMRRDTSNA